MDASPRLAWIVAQLGVQPGDDVLEIGGAHGVAAALVLERLGDGCFVGLDRSSLIVAAATQRNAADVAAGRAEFVVGGVGDPVLDDRRFDVIFAARVAAMTEAAALAAAACYLKPSGGLVLAFDSPSDARTATVVSSARSQFASAGLRELSSVAPDIDGTMVCCLRACRADQTMP